MDKQIIEVYSKHMGGVFQFKIFPGSVHGHDEINKIAKLAFNEVARVEDLLTDFRPSPFNQINMNAGIRPVEVDEEVFQIIERSLKLSEETKGAFDISFACVGHLWREHKRASTTPNESEMKEAASYIDYKNIELDHKKRSVYLPHKKMRIGLGGIGKGYAVDRGFDLLKKHGLSNFYFNGSGDIRVDSRSDAPRPWQVGVRNPFSEDPTKSCAYFKIHNGALATSGNYNNFIHKLGNRFHHILDPKTGSSSRDLVSVSIFSETAERADTTATSVMIMGQDRGLEFMNKNDLNGFLINENGEVLRSMKSHQILEQSL
ncbi:MAG: thiamine biosynthesis lipoprotein [Bacteriovoracaceae bacterium]|jgi:thiamine biosynthesis lipoprotein